jgi:hypothetical protein
MSHKLNPIIKIVADKCKYLLKIYTYDNKNVLYAWLMLEVGGFAE